MASFNENTVEQAALEWLRGLGYEYEFGPDIAPDETRAERDNYREVLLLERLRTALKRLNSTAPDAALEEAVRRVSTPEFPSLMLNNRAFHKLLVDGVETEVMQDGVLRGVLVRLVDWDNADANNWLAVNQFTVIDGQINRRPDVVVFLNGIPISVIELKNAKDSKATIENAYQQLRTYQNQISRLFVFNELLVISDGVQARLGCVGAEMERFQPWKTITGQELLPESLEALMKGVFNRSRLLSYLRGFVVFEDDGSSVQNSSINKKIAAYHQFFAVHKAVHSTETASSAAGDGKGGVVWHTQGSGKSLTMVFFAGQLVQSKALANPTIVILTDRNDLDDQLFGTFSRCKDLLRQTPVQAGSRSDLRGLLEREAGGVVFTTIQKFLPEERGDRFPTLSPRRNIVVIADEAHRSQYGFEAKVNLETGDLRYGFAQNVRDALPNATFLGFTGTPIETTDKNTRGIFGEYIDIYDVQRAVLDGATVPIYYESRLAKLDLLESEKPRLDDGFEEVTEGEEVYSKEKLKSKWAQLEALVGTRKRLEQVAQDLVDHFEARQSVMLGKGMIVCMSRRICVELYNEIIKLRPNWYGKDDTAGALKVVMTGAAADPDGWQEHIRSKARQRDIADHFRDATSSLKLVIVRDMWLTGFDVPSLHTIYLDKPMRGHGLMQAIARVNRVFSNKPGGLVVDYLGLANNLREALVTYTESGGQGKPTLDQEAAFGIMLEKLSICRGLFHGFDYSEFITGSPADRVAVLPEAQDFILEQDRVKGKERLTKASLELAKAFALSVPLEEALALRQEIVFFQTMRSLFEKRESTNNQASSSELQSAIQQLVERAVAPEGVIDIFAAAGLKKPDISILSESFLAEVREMPQRNLAVELLERLMKDEVKTGSKRNLVQSKKFSEKLSAALLKYQNRAIETAQVIEELIALAKEYRDAQTRGEKLGLADDEVAFYDALEAGDPSKVLADDVLRTIALEVAQTVRQNTTIDWSVREQVQANLRRLVKRVLRKYGYPPDKQEEATRIVLEQAKLMAQYTTDDLL
jgi:type I restriction enzyme, R subunit